MGCEMDRLRREMDSIYSAFAEGRGIAPTAGVFPALNMSEDDHNLNVRGELPGVAPENIDITTKQNNCYYERWRRQTGTAQSGEGKAEED